MTSKEDKTMKTEELEARIERLEKENSRLMKSLEAFGESPCIGLRAPQHPSFTDGSSLSNEQIERYSRQLLLHGGFGVEGQLKLLSSSVLVVGAGGIGSTVILYLAACGIGRLTIVDFDQVEISNLHRQVIHNSKKVGMSKAESACRAANDLNPTIRCQAVNMPLAFNNALDFVSKHDCVVDASDNPQTRYLVNDACVIEGKPLISGSAIGFEGQLTVYNYNNGPCYRCLYPKPNAAEGCRTCSDSGVLGTVPGLIGILQAVETVKVLTGIGDVMSHCLAMYDSLQCSFLKIKKPPKQPNCPVCGPNATILSMSDSEAMSVNARGPSCPIGKSPALPASLQISSAQYDEIRKRGDPHILLDVRVSEQFSLCSLRGAVNIPLKTLPERLDEVEELSKGTTPIYCICRRGIASVEATTILTEAASRRPMIGPVKNICGGLDAWRHQVDKLFPKY